MLNELDKYLEKRDIRFVRYADDFSLYAKSKEAAREMGNEVYRYLKNKLKLRVNRMKSGIRRPTTFKMLGFGFVPTYGKGDRGKYQLVVAEKGWKSFKQKLKGITKKTTPMALGERIARLNEVIRGWINHYRGASIYAKLRKVEGWLCNRLRYCIWHH